MAALSWDSDGPDSFVIHYQDTGYVEEYCAYGSVSQAQEDGCVEHVTADEIDALDTPAARYARGQGDGTAVPNVDIPVPNVNVSPPPTTP